MLTFVEYNLIMNVVMYPDNVKVCLGSNLLQDEFLDIYLKCWLLIICCWVWHMFQKVADTVIDCGDFCWLIFLTFILLNCSHFERKKYNLLSSNIYLIIISKALVLFLYMLKTNQSYSDCRFSNNSRQT